MTEMKTLTIDGNTYEVVDETARSAVESHTHTLAEIGAAASSHKHSAGDITSGILSATRGGTGFSSLADALLANYPNRKITEIYHDDFLKSDASTNVNTYELTASPYGFDMLYVEFSYYTTSSGICGFKFGFDSNMSNSETWNAAANAWGTKATLYIRTGDTTYATILDWWSKNDDSITQMIDFCPDEDGITISDSTTLYTQINTSYANNFGSGYGHYATIYGINL